MIDLAATLRQFVQQTSDNAEFMSVPVSRTEIKLTAAGMHITGAYFIWCNNRKDG